MGNYNDVNAFYDDFKRCCIIKREKILDNECYSLTIKVYKDFNNLKSESFMIYYDIHDSYKSAYKKMLSIEKSFKPWGVK